MTMRLGAPHAARRTGTARRLAAALLVFAAASALPAVVGAQTGRDRDAARGLAAEVDAVRDGVVRFSYAAREGVCGNGSNIRTRGGTTTVRPGSGRSAEWEDDCEPGPVRVSITRARGETVELRAYVGGRWVREGDRDVTDLGDVPPGAAAAYLLDVAATAEGEPASRAVFPATIADGVEPWPQLLRLARDERRPEQVRRDAIFWVGQAAGEAATRELSAIVDERDTSLSVREHAIFALSQRPAAEAVPSLIRIARTNPSPRLRQRAIFWLGQSRDPRALAYFEEVLLGR